MERIQKLWNEKPILLIFWIAILLRLIAAVFSQGYGMHDDHFSVIEASQSWVVGDDYNNWLPWNQENPHPQGHSFFYVGIHYILFSVFQFTGIIDPKIKMLIIRIIHALFSLITVYLGYKMTEKISDKKSARLVGLLLAAAWFMPFLSVRNLVEIVAIPLLMIGVWKILNAESRQQIALEYLLAGIIMGLAFSVRFQTLIFIGGVGLVILWQRKWGETFYFAFGILLSILAIQGLIDFFIWKRPFAEITEYIMYNWKHKTDYGADIWYMYISVLTAIYLFPLGLFILFGFVRKWKSAPLIFVPTVLFIVAHNMFPNKQERFIFTMIPFFTILGVVGWNEFLKTSAFWTKRPKLLKASYTFFWSINIVLLILFTTAYSKRARVESMVYLSKYKNEINSVLLEDTNRGSVSMLPAFYLGKWVMQYTLARENNVDSSVYSSCMQTSKYARRIYSPVYFKTVKDSEIPQFVLFYDDKNLDTRVENMKKIFPYLHPETVIQPGMLDKFMHWLNPVNKNMPVFIYKTTIEK